MMDFWCLMVDFGRRPHTMTELHDLVLVPVPSIFSHHQRIVGYEYSRLAYSTEFYDPGTRRTPDHTRRKEKHSRSFIRRRGTDDSLDHD